MKGRVVAISGFFTVMYLAAIFAATLRTQTQGHGATANEAQHGLAKAATKTPGELLTQNKRVSDKLSTLLRQQNPPVTDVRAASQGFTDLSQLFAAVHVSHNLGIPFDQLKSRGQASGSLRKAIHELRPDADYKAAEREALLQAVEDLDMTPGELLSQNKKLSDRLSTLLRRQNPPVTDLQAASQGFKILAQFVAAVHISENLGIPFDQLKTPAQTSENFCQSIHVLKPDADAKGEIKKAAEQYIDDMEQSQLGS